jgi:hypothetical protein
LVAVIVLIVLVVASAPIFGIFVWQAGRRVSQARDDAQTQRGHARIRLGFLLLLYGGISAFLFAIGLKLAVTGQPANLIVGLSLMALASAYGAVLYRTVVRKGRSSQEPAKPHS